MISFSKSMIPYSILIAFPNTASSVYFCRLKLCVEIVDKIEWHSSAYGVIRLDTWSWNLWVEKRIRCRHDIGRVSTNLPTKVSEELTKVPKWQKSRQIYKKSQEKNVDRMSTECRQMCRQRSQIFPVSFLWNVRLLIEFIKRVKRKMLTECRQNVDKCFDKGPKYFRFHFCEMSDF